MPIYEYVCESCHAQFEVLQGLHDPELQECRQCHQPTVTRLVSSAGFRLKGGGWYETDFKKQGDRKKNLVGQDKESISHTPEPVGDKGTNSTSQSTA